jgi:hypothetical protein
MAHGEPTEVKLGGFNAPTQDVFGAAGSARNDTMTAWARGDWGETACPMRMSAWCHKQTCVLPTNLGAS